MNEGLLSIGEQEAQRLGKQVAIFHRTLVVEEHMEPQQAMELTSSYLSNLMFSLSEAAKEEVAAEDEEKARGS